MSARVVSDCLRDRRCMPLAHYLREKTKADLVLMIIGDTSTPAGHANFLSGTCTADVRYVVNENNWIGVHELGHLMTAGHNGPHSGGNQCHAHVSPAGFKTIMFSYVSTVILNFSNPSVLYQGSPTGVTGTANNASCVRGRRAPTAKKRTSDCNFNGICDSLDIAAVTSEDCDRDGVPDECVADNQDLMGGCCINGTCSDRTRLCCLFSGGTWTSASCLSDFNLNSIPDACDITPIGACCVNAECDVRVRSWCLSVGGSFKGPGTVCGGDWTENGLEDGCESTVLGACCLQGAACYEILETDCLSAGGTFGGKGSVCEDCDGDGLPAVCEIAPNLEFGACCDEAGGKCTIRTSCSCHAGTFMGPGSACTATWCDIPY